MNVLEVRWKKWWRVSNCSSYTCIEVLQPCKLYNSINCENHEN